MVRRLDKQKARAARDTNRLVQQLRQISDAGDTSSPLSSSPSEPDSPGDRNQAEQESPTTRLHRQIVRNLESQIRSQQIISRAVLHVVSLDAALRRGGADATCGGAAASAAAASPTDPVKCSGRAEALRAAHTPPSPCMACGGGNVEVGIGDLEQAARCSQGTGGSAPPWPGAQLPGQGSAGASAAAGKTDAAALEADCPRSSPRTSAQQPEEEEEVPSSLSDATAPREPKGEVAPDESHERGEVDSSRHSQSTSLTDDPEPAREPQPKESPRDDETWLPAVFKVGPDAAFELSAAGGLELAAAPETLGVAEPDDEPPEAAAIEPCLPDPLAAAPPAPNGGRETAAGALRTSDADAGEAEVQAKAKARMEAAAKAEAEAELEGQADASIANTSVETSGTEGTEIAEVPADDSFDASNHLRPYEEGMPRCKTYLHVLEQLELQKQVNVLVPEGMTENRMVIFEHEGRSQQVQIPEGYTVGQQVPINVTKRPPLERNCAQAWCRGHVNWADRMTLTEPLKHSSRLCKPCSFDDPEFRQRQYLYSLLRGRSMDPILPFTPEEQQEEDSGSELAQGDAGDVGLQPEAET